MFYDYYIPMIYNHITEMIGNTPLLLIPQDVHKIPHLTLYAKLEYQNPFGSLKDRFAWQGIKDQIHILQHDPDAKILESSSGNTIKAIGGIANTFGIPSKTITNRIKVQEQRDMLMWMWVDIEQLPSDGECIDLRQRNNAVELIEKECKSKPNYLHTDQYRNILNMQIHEEQTGPEIYADVPQIDYFFWALGTTGSSGGVTRFLKSKNHSLMSIWVVSDDDDFIPGMRNIHEMDEVGIFDLSLYDDTRTVCALDAIGSMRRLNQKVGMMCWPTTGAVYCGLLDYFADHPLNDGVEKTAVLIACDRIEPYMSYIKQRVPEIFHRDHKHCILKVTHHDQEQYGQSLSVQELETLMDQKADDLLLFDVRNNKAFTLWHIPNSINIELNTLIKLTDAWNIFDHNKKIILLCPLGKQTQKLCTYLVMSWFDAYSLAWWLSERKKKHKT